MSSDQEERNWFLVLEIIGNHCKSTKIFRNQRKALEVTGNQQNSIKSLEITRTQEIIFSLESLREFDLPRFCNEF